MPKQSRAPRIALKGTILTGTQDLQRTKTLLIQKCSVPSAIAKAHMAELTEEEHDISASIYHTVLHVMVRHP
jgi:hypothetical protein